MVEGSVLQIKSNHQQSIKELLRYNSGSLPGSKKFIRPAASGFLASASASNVLPPAKGLKIAQRRASSAAYPVFPDHAPPGSAFSTYQASQLPALKPRLPSILPVPLASVSVHKSPTSKMGKPAALPTLACFSFPGDTWRGVPKKPFSSLLILQSSASSICRSMGMAVQSGVKP